MLEQIVPDSVCTAVVRGDVDSPPLLGDEVATIGPMVESRRREFSRGRACAHAALVQLGHPVAPILVGTRRQPLWPAGVVGSISHCKGLAVAAVANASDLVAIGVDVEVDAPLPARVLARISTPDERAAWSGEPSNWDRILFSAKESVYKVWYPLMRTWLGFGDATVVPCRRPGGFSARLHKPGPRELAVLEGRYLVAEGFVLTAVCLPA